MRIKVTIITTVFNGEKYLESCILSVLSQDYQNIEYVVIDGGSTDGSVDIVKKYLDRISLFVSEPDLGMYDGLNKGIERATGEVIGVLHADDLFASNNVVSKLVTGFNDERVNGVYGDLDYVEPQTLSVIRKWRSHPFSTSDLLKGWMPAHPTLFLRKQVFDRYGVYKLEFGSAADYELMVRFLYLHHIHAIYLPILMVRMRTGGQSNATLTHRLHGLKMDVMAARSNGLPHPLITVILKKLRKIKQYF